MNNLKKIARLIEKELGYTNGWKIPGEKYTAKCHVIASKIVSQLEPLVSPKVAVEYKDGWIILLKQGDITISYPKSDVKQFIEDLSRALNGERLSTLH